MLVPSHSTQPAGRASAAPDHIRMAPTGTAPLPVMVPPTSSVPLPSAGAADRDISTAPPSPGFSVSFWWLPPLYQAKSRSLRKYMVECWIPMVKPGFHRVIRAPRRLPKFRLAPSRMPLASIVSESAA